MTLTEKYAGGGAFSKWSMQDAIIIRNHIPDFTGRYAAFVILTKIRHILFTLHTHKSAVLCRVHKIVS